MINEHGEIFSCKFGKLRKRKPSLKGNGYYQIDLWKDNKCTYKSIHRLLAQMYLADYSEDLQVNHIDGNPTNNKLENLEMVTASENTQHAHRIGLCNPPHGEQHVNSKLNSQAIHEIRANVNKLTCEKLAGVYGVCKQQISRIQTKQRWGHI